MFRYKGILYSCIYAFIVLSFGNIANGYRFLWSAYDIPPLFRENSFRSACPQPNGQFSHPKYCDFFLNCWQGVATVGRCQYNLVFNERIRACDFKYNVDCGGKPISYEEPSTDPRCKVPFGTFVSSNDCSEYVVCNAGSAVAYKCPAGTYYNTNLAACNNEKPENCLSQEAIVSPTTTEKSKPSEPITSRPRPQKPITERPAENEVSSENPSPESIEAQASSPNTPVEASNPPDFSPPPPSSEKPPLEAVPGLIPRPTHPAPQKPKPEMPIGSEPTQKPSSEPILGLKPKPQPVLGQKPSTPTSIEENQTQQPIETIPDEDIVGPSRPVAAGTPTVAPFRPKPPLFPSNQTEQEPSSPEPDPSHPQSEEPSTSTVTTVPLKPKPPLTPETEEDKPVVDVSNVKPKPPFQPPGSKPNPNELPTPKPPILNPGSFKPQRPPNGNFDPSSTPSPVDGEDDPHILFPFLPQFPDSFRCPVNTAILPIVGDCASVIACIDGKGQRLRCPKGEHFDIIQRRCSQQRNFICQKLSNNRAKETEKSIIYGYLPVSTFNQLLKTEIQRIHGSRDIFY